MRQTVEAVAPGDSKVSMHVVRGLMEAVESAGHDPMKLLQAAEFDPARLNTLEARIPRGEVQRLCEAAVDLSGDPAFALHWVQRLNEGTFAPVSHLIAHATDLRHSLASLNQFHRLITDDVSFSVIEDDAQITLRVDSRPSDSPRMRRFMSEMLVGGLWNWIRTFRPNAEVSFHFMYPAPPYQQEYTRLFGHPQFDCAFTGLVFARALLDTPAPHRDDDVHQALSELAERRLSRINASTPYAARVREFLVQEGWKEHSSMEASARALSLSVRSLRRRLSEEGTSYFALVNEALGLVAKRLLSDERRTIQEVAFEMGFSDASSFHRAFKRWTGMTPNSFRNERE